MADGRQAVYNDVGVTMTFNEFCQIIDATDHPRGIKLEMWSVFNSDQVRVFYPNHVGYHKYRIDGENRLIQRSIDHDGSRDDGAFVYHQEFRDE